MAKTPSTKLFQLIKSLSSSEKRYFKLFVNTPEGSSNKYIQLFDAIDAQSVFDEKALQKEIYPLETLESRKYSELKSYLYELVLKSLQAYDEKTSVDYKLKNYLLGVRTLYRRSHFEEGRDILKKAKRIASKYEQFTSLLEILSWEKEISYAQADIAQLEEDIENIHAEEQQVLANLQQLTEYRNIFFRLLIAVRKGNVFQQAVPLQQLVEHPLLQDQALAKTHLSKVLFYRIWSVYAYATLDWEQFYNYGKELLKIMESRPYFLKEDISEYISALSNFVASCSVLKRYDTMADYLERFQTIKPQTTDDRLKIHRQYYLNKFEWCVKTGEFEQGLQAFYRHQKEKKAHDEQLFNSSSFYFFYFYIHFGAGKYDEALHYLNEWLNQPKSIERQGLQGIARLLNLIVHFELGNDLLLESLLRSTYRYLKQHNQLLELEKRMLDFIKNLEKMPDRQSHHNAFVQFKKDLLQLSNDPAEATILNFYFDVVSWLDSKIEGRAFAAVVKEKYQQLTAS